MSDIKSYFAKNQSKAHENFLHANGANTAKNVTKGATKGGGGDPLAAVAKLIGDVTVGVYSANKQIQLQKDLAKLSGAQQARLSEELAKAQTKQQKLALLQQAQIDAKNRSITMIVVGSLIGIAGIVLAVVLIRKRK